MTTNKTSHLELIGNGLRRQRSFLKGLKKAENEGLIDLNVNIISNDLHEIEVLLSQIKQELPINQILKRS